MSSRPRQSGSLTQELAKGLRFSLFSLVLFSLLYVHLYAVAPWNLFEEWTARVSAFTLNALYGTRALVSVSGSLQGTQVLLLTEKTAAEFIPLCTGFLEFAVLASVILASEDRTLRQRLKGVALGFAAVLLVNPLRIAVTFHELESKGVAAGEFWHNALFRAALFALVLGVYAAWYLRFSRKKK
ncbi:MAG TPA: exosortase/archaeosortase family protein [archaeon]|nr:exosortase/archaeosortase family protein [archaeon]